MFDPEIKVLTQLAAQVGCGPTDSVNYYGTIVKLPVLKNHSGDAVRLESIMTVHATVDPYLPEFTVVCDKQDGVFYKVPHETKPA